MNTYLPCGHPIQCDTEDEGCEWCHEVETLREDIKHLMNVLDKKAVVVKDGATAEIEGPIGYLYIAQGTVNFKSREQFKIDIEPK